MKAKILAVYIMLCVFTLLFHLIGVGLAFPTDVPSGRYAVVHDDILDEKQIITEDEKYHKGLLKDAETVPTEYEIRSWDTHRTLDGVSITYEYSVKYSVEDSRIRGFHKKYEGRRWEIKQDAKDCASSMLQKRVSDIAIKSLLENDWYFRAGIDCNNVDEVRIDSVTSNEPIWRPQYTSD